MVGCVIAEADRVLSEGWHRQFGGAHAEVDAIRQLPAGTKLDKATIYVSLEPCCHTGKTPPCTEAILSTEIGRVVIAMADPFAKVAGGGVARLQAAGREVIVGCEQQSATELNRPYLKRVQKGMPWVIAKWAMTLDGKIASKLGDSQWISSEASREIVHQLRGRMDAIIVGRGTAEHDDPQLTARPPGPRVATRVVMDRGARLSLESQLVRSLTRLPCWLPRMSLKSSRRRDGHGLLHCGMPVLR